MNMAFTSMLSSPDFVEDGVHIFGGEADADPFDETDAAVWRDGRFERAIAGDARLTALIRPLVRSITDPFVEVACGPGMGLAPTVLRLNPELHVLATDASRLVLSEWRRFLDSSASDLRERITLAQCSLFDLPLADESVGCVTSFLGLGSTRSGEEGIARALAEVKRILKPGGVFITVENQWKFDRDELVALFAKMNRPIWPCFDENLPTWSERFERARFETSEKYAWSRAVKADDNELGEAAVKNGVDIELEFKLYVNRKALK